MLKSASFARAIQRRLYSQLPAHPPPTVVSDEAHSWLLPYHHAKYPWRWLRDSCQCPSCLQPSTLQKLHRTSDVDPDIKPAAYKVTKEGVHVTWEEGHDSFFSRQFLRNHVSLEFNRNFHRDPHRVHWNAGRITLEPNLFQSYGSLKKTTGLHAAIRQLARYGLLFIKNVPTDKTSNEECELRTMAEMFGEIRKTFYGETWDVKNVRNSRNIAYTNVDLGLHMDLLYFQSPPRYQILHCLRNRVKGGKSIFVDALHAATQLRKTDFPAFHILAKTPVRFHYINDGHHLHYSHPTIQLGHWKVAKAYPIDFINYSPPFQAPLPLNTPAEFYNSMKKFSDILDTPAMQFEYLLKEGDAVIFDNRRVLHSRTAFEEPEAESDEEETNRWLKGCYLEADAVLDRGRMLNKQLEAIMRGKMIESESGRGRA